VDDLFTYCSDTTKDGYLSFPTAARGDYQQSLDGSDIYCLLDFETTGFSPERDRVIEVAAAKVSGGEVIGRLNSFIDPERAIPHVIVELTGIDDSMVAGSPTIKEYMPELVEFIGDSTVVGYSRLEEYFLRELYPANTGVTFSNLYIDAFDLAMILLPSLRRHRQADLACIWGMDTGAEHRARDDVETLVCVFEALLNGLYQVSLPLLKALIDHSPTRPSGLSVLLRNVLNSRAGGRPVEKLKLEQLIAADRSWEKIAPLEGDPVTPDITAEDVKKYFSADGPISRQYGDYEERDEQLQMSEATLQALRDGSILLVEAGTGTGKSLAYLVPCMMWARESGLPVVVSTRTLNLQDQLFTKDLPLLESAAGKGSFRYSVLKGYSNYICPRKLQSLLNGRRNLSEAQVAVLGMLLTWLSEGAPGDVSMLNVSYLRGLDYIVMADHRDCPGERCPFSRNGRCYYRAALYRAKRSHIVVVNHSLLLSGINLQFDNAVIDEAHTLEDVATDQFSCAVDYRESKRFLEHLYSPIEGTGFLADLEPVLEEHVEREYQDLVRRLLDDCRGAVDSCMESLETLFLALSDLNGLDRPGANDVRFSEGVKDTVEYLRVESEGEAFVRSLEALNVSLARFSNECRERGDESLDLEYQMGDLTGKADRVVETRVGVESVLFDEDRESVRWASTSPPDRLEYQTLYATPIDVGPMLKEFLYDELRAMVMTSATLTVKDSFDFYCSRAGLDMVEPGRLHKIILDSSFDYETQMQILILHDMPEPNSKEYKGSMAEVLSEAIRAAGGGVLALFTNRRLMLDTHDLISDEMRQDGLNVLCQRPGFSRRRIAEEFIDDPGASLFGTSSFWEGVDARGDTLRLVAVTRIPFESPGRPVFEARSERVRELGGSDFNDLSLPLAALKLKQGVGRLIRTRQDRGQILLLDSRINSRNYGKVLLQTLPKARRRRVSLDEVGRAISDFHKKP
jgi:predicted DnaQ family exonuclease/DinG family helicase